MTHAACRGFYNKQGAKTQGVSSVVRDQSAPCPCLARFPRIDSTRNEHVSLEDAFDGLENGDALMGESLTACAAVGNIDTVPTESESTAQPIASHSEFRLFSGTVRHEAYGPPVNMVCQPQLASLRWPKADQPEAKAGTER
jgi:hypothetical protein